MTFYPKKCVKICFKNQDNYFTFYKIFDVQLSYKPHRLQEFKPVTDWLSEWQTENV